jgi:hypothetical protein
MKILDSSDFVIYLRPHPSDRRFYQWKDLAKKYNINFSNALQDSTLDFLTNADLVIAGESSIHLEAVLLNILSICYDPKGKSLDLFGYVRNKLIPYYENLESLIFGINQYKKNRPNVRSNAKIYCDNIDTLYDGKSILLVTDALSSIHSKSLFDSFVDENKNQVFYLPYQVVCQ